jgi:RHS repeat-associated protein
MTAGAGRTITWTSSNLPALIHDTPSGNETAFTYGPGRERIEQRTLRGGLTTTVTYIDAVYEKRARLGEADELVHYIRAGATVAIFTEIDDGLALTDKTRYLHKDHLGSIEAISDEAGAVTEYLSYDPHGKRRLADWQPGTPTGAGAETPRGFTGHEMLDGVGLIHMNGRVYDPTLGRFISADPVIQYPQTTQGFNRYTYVNNNPLSFTDPSGFGFFSSIAGFFKSAVKGVVNYYKGLISVAQKALSNPYVRTALAIAAVYFIGPAVAGLVSNAVIVGGAASATAIEAAVAAATLIGNTVGGAVAGAAGGLIAGAGDLKSAGIGALTGGLFGFVGASSAFGPVTENTASRIVAHGVIGGVTSRLGGGKFGPAAFASAFAKFATPVAAQFGRLGGALATAAIGGTASVIGGGKFQNGAITAAFAYLLNECAGGCGTLFSMGYTKIAGLPVIRHSVLIGTDTYSGESFAFRGGPGNVNGCSGPFLCTQTGSFNEAFKDPPSSIVSYQRLGILNVSLEAVKYALDDIARGINASEIWYKGIIHNSNTAAFWAARSFDFYKPTPFVPGGS